MDFLEDDLEVIDFIFHEGLPRQIYVRNDYFNSYDNVAFHRRFRISKDTAILILSQIEEYLEFPSYRNNCVSPMNQLLITLRLYSTGGHLQSIADYCGVHISTACRIVKRVSMAIARLSGQYIKMPSIDNETRMTQREFFEVAAFPRVIGAIDCTHIKIQSLGGEDAEIFRNRKSYFSVNVQMICSAKLKILNVVARWPGSTHDSTIFNNSQINMDFENNRYRNCLLLGDSGYALKHYLLTPLLYPRTPAEQLYNETHIRTRNCIERCFGVIKRRFPILAYGSRLCVNNTLTVIIATSVLHNLAIETNDELPVPPDEMNDHDLNILIHDGQIPAVNADSNVDNGLRRNIINNYFANL